jgi:hypothetical protein
MQRFFDWLYFAVGLPLLLVGAGLMVTAVVDFLGDSAEYPADVLVVGFLLFGLLPFALGVWLCRSPFEKGREKPTGEDAPEQGPGGSDGG